MVSVVRVFNPFYVIDEETDKRGHKKRGRLTRLSINFTNNGALKHERRWRRRGRSSRRKRRKGEEANKGQEANQPEEDRRILSENDVGKTDRVNVERFTVIVDADKSPIRRLLPLVIRVVLVVVVVSQVIVKLQV